MTNSESLDQMMSNTSISIPSTQVPTSPPAEADEALTEPPRMLEPVRQVLSNPELLARIIGHLDNGSANHILRTLPVSQAFFHAAGSTLCRRIEVPLYEYSRRKTRGEYLPDLYCVSCKNENPGPYRQEWGAACHQSLHSDLSRACLSRIRASYRERFPATAMMKEMYKHVRVITIEQHDCCDMLAQTHPIPLARTVIARGGHRNVCLPSQNGLKSGFLPRHPFRLVLDYLCTGLICQRCTSPTLLSEHVETLVLRFQHDSPYSRCTTRELPSHFKPKRLVLLFQQEQKKGGWGTRDAEPDDCHMVAYGPGEGSDSRNNNRLARMALAVSEDCRVYIVAADNAALHVRGLERHEETLGAFKPLYPHPKGKRDEILEWRLIKLPDDAHWIHDDKGIEPHMCKSADGELQTLDEAYDRYGIYDIEEYKERQRIASGRPIMPCRYVCYAQDGRIVSTKRACNVPKEDSVRARTLIDKRVAIMETLVHRWVDYILDARLPSEHRKAEMGSGRWDDWGLVERAP